MPPVANKAPSNNLLNLEEKLETGVQKAIPENIKSKLNMSDVVKAKMKIVKSYLSQKNQHPPKPLIPRDILQLLVNKGIGMHEINKLSLNLKTKMNAIQAGGKRTRKAKHYRNKTRRQ